MINARSLAMVGPLDRRFEVSRLCVFDKRLLWLWQRGIRPAAERPFGSMLSPEFWRRGGRHQTVVADE